MKRLDNLITEQNITVDFCVKCIIEASKNKKARKEVAHILKDLEKYAINLRDMVLNETFEPSPCTVFTKVEYGKKRNIEKPAFFPDQAIHHLLMILIRDRLIKRLDPFAIASIEGRGVHYGVRKLRKWMSADDAPFTCKYVVKGDIKKCFASIRPNVIYEAYKKMIKDKKYLRLKHKVLFQHSSLPLGNYCSSFDLNFLLVPLDQMIRQQKCVTHCIRYMDDFIILCDDGERARELKPKISSLLSSFNLQLKETYSLSKTEITGIDFIDYRFFFKNTILRKRNLFKILKLMYKMQKYGYYRLHDCRSLISLMGMCTHCHSTWLIHHVLKTIDFAKVKKIIGGASRNGI